MFLDRLILHEYFVPLPIDDWSAPWDFYLQQQTTFIILTIFM